MQAAIPQPPPKAIVVTGKALPKPAADKAYGVQTIDRKQLQDAPSHQLDTILEQVPGLQMFRRSDSTTAHPTSEGVTLRALGGNASSRALLLLDGVPQADPFGGWINWPAYAADGLQQVQVIRGGGSVDSGPGALAGVIDMTSRTDRAAEGSIELGSRNSGYLTGYGGTDLGRGIFTVSGSAGISSGFIPITPPTRGPVDRRAAYDQADLRTRWVTQIGGDTELQLGGLAFVDRRERGQPFTANRTRGADASVRLVGHGEWQWSALAYGQWRHFTSSFASTNVDRTAATRVLLQTVPSTGFGGAVEVRPPLGAGAQLRIGADARLVNGQSDELANYVDAEPTKSRVAGGRAQTEGMFAEASLTRGSLTLSGGARLDHWRISDGELIERTIATGALTRDDLFPVRQGWRPTARAGAVLDLRGGFSLRSAAYLGWRMPTLNELFRPFRAGQDATAANPLLKAETLAGAEAGADYKRGAVTLSLTAFVNRLHDAIANVTLGHGPGTFPGVGFVAGRYLQRENIDAVRVRGVEASAEGHRGAWSLRLGASYANARVEASGAAADLDGLRPAQTPRLSLDGSIGWDSRGRSFALEFRRVGSQFEDDQNQLRMRPATTVDGFVAWPITRRLQFIARGENLLNETVIAAINDDGSIEQATPRTLWIGIRLRSGD